MVSWHTIFETFRPLASLPVLEDIAAERQTGPDYHLEGRYRAGDRNSIFKYTLRGEGRYRDASGEHRVPAGSGFLCEVRNPASAYYYPPNATAPWEFVFISFSGGGVTELIREMTARCGPVFTLPADRGAMAKILGWSAFGGTRVPVTPAAGAALVQELFTDLLASRESTAPDPGNRLAAQAQEAIRAGLRGNLTVAGLARTLGVSREHLTRVFHDQLGQTPWQYILRQKMVLAGRLLKESRLSVKEIGDQVGGGSPALFGRRFKAVMHLSPGTFRKVGIVPVR